MPSGSRDEHSAAIAAGGAVRRPPLPALTGVRFLAALGVLAFHVNFEFGVVAGASFAETWLGTAPRVAQVVDSVGGFGSLGVNFFFVLSGFILTWNYLADSGPRGAVCKFYVARFARIYPVYALALAASICYRIYVGNPCPDDICGGDAQPLVGIASVFLVQAWLPFSGNAFNGPGWTLSVEAFFYAMFPLLIVVGSRVWHRVPPLVTLIGALAATQIGTVLVLGLSATDSVTPGVGVLIQFAPVFRLAEFTAGIAACVLFMRPSVQSWRPSGHLVDAACIVLVVLAVLAGEGLLRLRVPAIAVNLGALDGFFVLIILALATGRGLVAAALRGRTMSLLGESSYALYIIHWPLWFWMSALVLPDSRSPLFLAAYAAAAVAVSVPIHLYVERPSRRWIMSRYRAASQRRSGMVSARSRA